MKNKNKKSNINTNSYASMIIFVITIVIILIVVGYLIRNNFNCEGDMFSYSGAVIGGGLTLIGVIITMLYQEIKREEDRIQRENEKKEELAIQYKPFLKLELMDDIINDDINNFYTMDDTISHGYYILNINKNSNHFYKLKFCISNHGDGECYLFCDDIYPSYKNSNQYIQLNLENIPESEIQICKGWNIVIPRHDKAIINIFVLYDNTDTVIDGFIDLFIKMRYHDQFNYKKYDGSANINFSLEINNESSEIISPTFTIYNRPLNN